jgi:hypothetical protein
MIYESYIYKNDLLKIAKRMEKRLSQKRWPEHSLFLFEKDIFLAFFIIRKLIEAKTKLTQDIADTTVELEKFFPTGKNPTIKNDHKFDELYDLNKSNKCKRVIYDICGDIIHSYIFAPCFDDKNKICGFLFNSFKYRQKGLYAFDLQRLIEILKVFGNDYPNYQHFKFNSKTDDYDVVSKSEPPEDQDEWVSSILKQTQPFSTRE